LNKKYGYNVTIWDLHISKKIEWWSDERYECNEAAANEFIKISKVYKSSGFHFAP
jgi:hypothetical protein